MFELILSSVALVASIVALIGLVDCSEAARLGRSISSSTYIVSHNLILRVERLDQTVSTLLEENKSLREQLNVLGDCCEINSIQLKSLNKKQ